MRLVFTASAEHDLRKIVRYTNDTWGRDQAVQYLAGLTDHVGKLCCHPQLGAITNKGESGTRRWAYRHHVAYYRIVADEIRVIRILHMSQEPGSHLP